MSYSDIVAVVSGILQLAVPCYALRLSMRFGTNRVGWLVFGALSLLAVVHSLLAIIPFHSSIDPGAFPDIIYAVVSVLLLASIARLQRSLATRSKTEGRARESLSAWESEVEAKLAELTKANAELLRSDAKRQAELEGQMKLREEQETTYQSLLTAARQTEDDLLQTISVLQAKVAEQERQLNAAHRAGMAAVAAGTLESVNSLSLLANELSKARGQEIVRAARVLQKRPAHGPSNWNAGRRKLADPLAHLARHLADDRSVLQQKIEAVKRGLEFAVNPGTDPAFRTADQPAPAPALRAGADSEPQLDLRREAARPDDYREHLIDNLTETGTEAGEQDQATTPTEEAKEVAPDSSEFQA